MKKNIKFIGAAAAALLAVAPVVSTGVANAATTVPVEVSGAASTNNQTTTKKAVVSVSVSNVNEIKANAAASSLKVNLSSTFGTPKINGNKGKAAVYAAADVTIDKNTGIAKVKSGAKAVETLKPGTEYAVVVSDVTLSGFTANEKDVTLNGQPATVDTYGNIVTGAVTVGTTFTTPNPNLTGEPYVYTVGTQNGVANNTVVSNGMVKVAANSSNNSVSVANIVSAIEKAYKPNAAGTATASFTNLEGDVNTALNTAGITVNNGSFTAPASGVFTVNVSVSANNGKTATFPVLVAIDANALTDAQVALYPVISYNGQDMQANNNTLNAASEKALSSAAFTTVSLNGKVDTDAIKAAFKAYVNKDKNQSLSVSVDTSKVNTAVAGKYPVTVSATNANGNTTKVTFNVTVGQDGATYKSVKTEGKIYTVNGNTATETNDSVKEGANLATFGTVKIGDVEYTRINSKTSDKFVKSSVFTDEKKTDSRIMWKSIVYDKNGNKREDVAKIAAYTRVTVLGDAVTINGKTYYKIGDNKYVRTANVEMGGITRKLKHNAYIYNNKGKRVQKSVVLKKGSEKKTFGGSYKIKGKKYYRINENQYVKAANFE